jgi:hypothetical protein
MPSLATPRETGRRIHRRTPAKFIPAPRLKRQSDRLLASNSKKCSEAADGVAHKSEGRSRLSLLRPVRQDQPRRHPAHAYAQCRSNKGAPGVDGQDFADIAAYGVERWLAELALALRQERYRPAPIRRVFIPRANGKLRPLGISTVRDRVCMTAAMLVLEPIPRVRPTAGPRTGFDADLPPEIYAYRAGRNAQQAAVEVESCCFVAIGTSWTPTSRTTSGAFRIPTF